MFLNIQIDLLILKTYYGQFTLTTKNHCISSLMTELIPFSYQFSAWLFLLWQVFSYSSVTVCEFCFYSDLSLSLQKWIIVYVLINERK